MNPYDPILVYVIDPLSDLMAYFPKKKKMLRIAQGVQKSSLEKFVGDDPPPVGILCL